MVMQKADPNDLEDITHLPIMQSKHHAVAVRKNNGKTKLYMNYDGNFCCIIRNGEAKFKESIRAINEPALIAKLQKLKYQYEK